MILENIFNDLNTFNYLQYIYFQFSNPLEIEVVIYNVCCSEIPLQGISFLPLRHGENIDGKH